MLPSGGRHATSEKTVMMTSLRGEKMHFLSNYKCLNALQGIKLNA
jgi:hypothetical protein